VKLARVLALLSTVLAASLVGCEEEPEDVRFATPEATIRTLLATYGVQDMSQEEIQRHMRGRGGFELRDEVTYRMCFTDYTGPEHEGFAGYVFGTIAAGKDQLRVVRVEGRVHVYPNPDRVDRYVVLDEGDDGLWRITLNDSVPADIKRALLAEYERISTRAKRAGTEQ
jgi:hypothetical protein